MERFTALVRALYARQPDITSREVARQLGVERRRASSALTAVKRRPVLVAPGPRKARRARVQLPVVSHFQHGEGERREDCGRYEECLSGWVLPRFHVAGLGHCAAACAHYTQRDRLLELGHMATSRPDLDGDEEGVQRRRDRQRRAARKAA